MAFLSGLFAGLAVVFVLLLAGYTAASVVRPLRWFYCHVLPWHSPSPEHIGFDGCSVHARCRWCGYEGMLDSNGDLF